MGGIFRLKLNDVLSPIAYKYREGKMKSTLKREFNAPETAVVQAFQTFSSVGVVFVCAVVSSFGASRSAGLYALTCAESDVDDQHDSR